VEIKLDHPVDVYIVFDTQHRPGLKRNPLVCYAYDIVTMPKKPDYIFGMGDFWDMPSLSSYDKGKHSFSENCYFRDVRSGNEAMAEFWQIIQIGFKNDLHWKPVFVFCLGNHEDRITRAKDTTSTEYLEVFEEIKPDFTNWTHVMPFLEPFVLNDVYFAHYFSNEFSPKAIGRAHLILKNKHISAICGHKQFLDIAENPRGNKRMMAVINGCSYFPENPCDNYRGPQNHSHFRGSMVARNLFDGMWEAEFRNLQTLWEKYGTP